jgi:hypothetical protein
MRPFILLNEDDEFLDSPLRGNDNMLLQTKKFSDARNSFFDIFR